MNKKIKDIKYQIVRLMDEIVDINSSDWEHNYKEKCGERFVSYVDFLNAIVKSNPALINETAAFLKECKYDIQIPSISEVLSVARRHNLANIGEEAGNVICAACVCEHCEFANDCNGECADCKRDTYKRYSWNCEE